MDFILSRIAEIIVGGLLMVLIGMFLDWLDGKITRDERLPMYVRHNGSDWLLILFVGLTFMALGHTVISWFAQP